MNRVGYQGTTALCAIVVVVMAFGAAMNSAASAEALEELCGACKVEVFVKGGKFLEGPAFDQAGNLWVVNIESGWVSKVTPDGKWSDEFNTGGQPQGLKFHKDGRLFGVDRKKGVFIYDPKTKKMSDYVLPFRTASPSPRMRRPSTSGRPCETPYGACNWKGLGSSWCVVPVSRPTSTAASGPMG